MRQKVHESLHHIMLTILLGVGFLLCVFTFFGLPELIGHGLLVFACVSALFFLASLRKSLMIGIVSLSILAIGIWFFLFDGLQMLTDTFISLLLFMTSVKGALPLFAFEASTLLAVLISGLSFLAASEDVGPVPACLMIVFLLFYAWIFQAPVFLLYMIPSVVAAVIMSVKISDLPWQNMRTVLPLAVLLTLLSFLCTPQSGITIQPLKETADNIRQRIMDYLFYTEPRTVFSLASEGYYPNGSSLLGGTAVPNDHLVMAVKTSRRVYLRGAVKNEYTGRAWIDTTGGRRYLWISPRWLSVRNTVFNQSLPSSSLSSSPLLAPSTFSVQMASTSASDLFVPQRVMDLTCSGDIIPYFNQASEIFATRDLVAGDAWTVRSSMAVFGQQGLDEVISLCAMQDDPDYRKIVENYTRLPAHLSSQLYDLAHSITSGKTTTYEQVQAMINYLRTHCTYSLEVDPVPDTADFVSFFLLQTQEGYCTYFATALTVLCRMNGIPARYVEGFLVAPSSSGTTYVTGHDGHAWTEIYFPGFGWLTAEATSGRSGTQSSPSDSRNSSQSTGTVPPANSPDPHQNTPSPAPSPSPSPSLSPTPSPVPQEKSSSEPSVTPPEISASDNEEPSTNSNPILWILLLLLLFVVALRIFLTQPQKRAARKHDPKDVWLVWIQEILDILHVMNYNRAPAETHAAFFERVGTLGAPFADLRTLSDCASAVFYGHEIPVDDDILLYRSFAQQLYSQLSRLQKLRLILHRIRPASSHL